MPKAAKEDLNEALMLRALRTIKLKSEKELKGKKQLEVIRFRPWQLRKFKGWSIADLQAELCPWFRPEDVKRMAMCNSHEEATAMEQTIKLEERARLDEFRQRDKKATRKLARKKSR